MELLGSAMFGIVIFMLFSGFFWGFVRKMNRTLLRLLTLVLALGCAYLFTELFGNMVGRYIVSMLQPLLGETVGEILSNSELSIMADAVCEMIAAPILFILFYFILKTVFWIVYKIFAVSLNVRGPRTCGRMLGSLVGLLCGVVGIVAFVTPVFGYLNLTNNALNQLAPDEPEVQELSAALVTMMETPVAKQSYDFLGKYMFTGLTTVDFENDEISLEQEVTAILSILEDFTVLAGSSADEMGEREAQALRKMAQDVGHSKIVSTVVARVIANAAESWLKGEDALGMSKIDMGKEMEGITNTFLAVFMTSTAETVPLDLGTFADAFAILVEADVFTMGTDTADFVTKLVSSGVVSDLYAVLDKNPRMIPVKTAIRNTGVRVMMDTLGVGDDLRETHSEMLENMAGTLKDATKADGTIDTAVLSSGLNDILKDNEVTVSQETTELIADAVVEYLTPEEIQTLPPEELADKLAERFLASGDSLPEGIVIPEGVQLPGNVQIPNGVLN